MRIRVGISAVVAAIGFTTVSSAQEMDAGRKSFESRCARCHGADGNGGEMGPAIRERLPARDDKDLRQFIHTGVPARGMPPAEMPSPEMDALVKFLRGIERRPESKPIVRTTVRTTDGKTVDGRIMGEGLDDLQVLGDDNRLYLFRRAGDRFRAVTSQNDWPTYNGDPRGNRYTTMDQITRDNVGRLSPKWVFNIPGGGSSQVISSMVLRKPSDSKNGCAPAFRHAVISTTRGAPAAVSSSIALVTSARPTPRRRASGCT